MARGDNAAVLERAVNDWNRGDLLAYLQLYDPKVVLHGLGPGINAVRSMYEGMWKIFPKSRLDLDDVIVEGDKLACRYTWRGVDPKSGDQVVTPGLTIMHFRERKVVERWDFEGTEQNVT